MNILKNNLKLIAFYLPQFYPTPENDKWWGKGFTEWTNVVKATPQFENHYQPHLPADLGFYDLRVPETRNQQAELAQEYGIFGFCYYYYWFNGQKILDRPLQEILKLKKPNFPFCLCWANENWHRGWDGYSGEILLSQEYSFDNYSKLIKDLFNVFMDDRYIRINGRPLFIIYMAELLPNLTHAIEIIRELSLKHGIGELFLCCVAGYPINDSNLCGFDAALEFPPHGSFRREFAINESVKNKCSSFVGHIFDFRSVVFKMTKLTKPKHTLFRGVMPSWDNTARKKNESAIFIHSSPELYKQWLKNVCNYTVNNLRNDEQFVFINAWNEWGEGCHLEPDMKYGRAFLEATKSIVTHYRYYDQPDLRISKKNK